MACTVEVLEEQQGEVRYDWVCCHCGNGPWSYRFVGKCLDCSHEVRGCKPVKWGSDFRSDVWSYKNSPLSVRTCKRDKEQRDVCPADFRTRTQLEVAQDHNSTRQKNNGYGWKDEKEDCRTPCKDYTAAVTLSTTKKEESVDTPYISCPSPSSTSDSGLSSSSGMSTPRSPSYERDECLKNDIDIAYLVQRVLGRLHLKNDGSLTQLTGIAKNDESKSFAPSQFESDTARRSRGAKKRRNGTGNGSDDGDNDNDEHDRSKRPKSSNTHSSKTDHVGPLFACIFLKNNPSKFVNWDSCKKTGYSEVHRMKEHMYRRHRHFTCPRCLHTFRKEADFEKHEAAAACGSRTVPTSASENQIDEDDIDENTYMRHKDRRGLKFMDERTKWERAYRIQFGDNVIIPSPYFDQSERRNQRAVAQAQLSHMLQGLSPELSRQIAASVVELLGRSLIPRGMQSAVENRVNVILGQTSSALAQQTPSDAQMRDDSAPPLSTQTDTDSTVQSTPLSSTEPEHLYSTLSMTPQTPCPHYVDTPQPYLGTGLLAHTDILTPTLVPLWPNQQHMENTDLDPFFSSYTSHDLPAIMPTLSHGTQSTKLLGASNSFLTSYPSADNSNTLHASSGGAHHFTSQNLSGPQTTFAGQFSYVEPGHGFDGNVSYGDISHTGAWNTFLEEQANIVHSEQYLQQPSERTRSSNEDDPVQRRRSGALRSPDPTVQENRNRRILIATKGFDTMDAAEIEDVLGPGGLFPC